MNARAYHRRTLTERTDGFHFQYEFRLEDVSGGLPDDQQMKRVIDWCEEQFSLDSFGFSGDARWATDEIDTFWFKSIADATAFKIRWC